MIIRRGYCTCCFLAASDAEELDRLMRAGRLPWGTLRKFGVSKDQAWYHRRHLGRQVKLVYYVPSEWERRKESARELKRWRWKPGVSGNIRGRPKGARDRKPRRKPNGIAAAIRSERQERAERLQLQRLALIAELSDEA